MADYEIKYIGDSSIKDMHHIGINCNGNYYSVIFGKYANGGFCCIPNWSLGCELSSFKDIFWNTESLYRILKNKKAAEAIAKAIAEVGV